MHVQGFCFAHLNLRFFAVLVEVVVVVASATAKGCNIVCQQLPTLLDVTCCVLLHVRHFPRTENVKKSRDQGLAVKFAV